MKLRDVWPWFRAEFRWYVKTVRVSTSKTKEVHRNPVALALEWRQALYSGRYSSQADLARKKGISRARVTQILQLLKLGPGAKEVITALGDPLTSHVITERSLRPIVRLTPSKQLMIIRTTLLRTGCSV